MSPVSFTVVGAVAVVGLVAASAFFSSTETAIFTLSEEWVDGQDPADDDVASLQRLRADPHRLLVTILVGNNVVNVAIASLTTVLALEYLPTGGAVTLATVLASVLVLIFGEIVPKSYGLGHAESWSLRVARPVSVLGWLLYPLVVVFDLLTRRLTALLGGDADIEEPYVED